MKKLSEELYNYLLMILKSDKKLTVFEHGCFLTVIKVLERGEN